MIFYSSGTGNSLWVAKELYVQGTYSLLKTYLIYPLFRKQGIKRNLFSQQTPAFRADCV
jgi:hypothetical protein